MSKTMTPIGNAAERLKTRRSMPTVFLPEVLPSEHAPAVEATAPVHTAGRIDRTKRPYRISTYLSADAGACLDRLVAHFKRTQGRRRSAPDVLERALFDLARALNL